MAMLLDLKQKQDDLIEEVNDATKKTALSESEIDRIAILQQEIKSLYKKLNRVGVSNEKDEASESISDFILQFSRENEILQSELEELNKKSQEELLIKSNLNWLLLELNALEDIDPLINYIQFQEDVFHRIVKRCVVFKNGRIIFELNIGISRTVRVDNIANWIRKNKEIKNRNKRKFEPYDEIN